MQNDISSENRDQLDMQLFEAVIHGDVDEIEKLYYERGADLNVMVGGRRPLHAAMSADQIGSFEKLIALNADIDARDARDFSPLDQAAISADDRFLTPVLWYGAAINAQGKDGHTAFHRAAEMNCRPACRKLLSVGASPDIAMQSQEGVMLTPEELAEALGHEGLHQYLNNVRLGKEPVKIDVETIDKNRQAIETRRLKAMLPFEDQQARNMEFSLAVHYDDREGMVRLHAQHANVNAPIGTGDGTFTTSLIDAITFGTSEETVALLLQMGAEVDAVDSHGMTALHYAAKLNKTRLMKLLIEDGADLHGGGMPVSDTPFKGVRNVQWSTPLHTTARAGSREALYLLLAAGADEDRLDEHGKTAFDVAAQANYGLATDYSALRKKRDEAWPTPKNIEALIGIPLDMKRREQALARKGQKAAGENREGLLYAKDARKHLLSPSKSVEDQKRWEESRQKPIRNVDDKIDLNQALLTAVQKGTLEEVQQAIEAGGKVDTLGKKEKRLLHFAAEREDGGPIIDLLLKQGANMVAEDEKGNTPLHLAAGLHHLSCMRVLIEGCMRLGRTTLKANETMTEEHLAKLKTGREMARSKVIADRLNLRNKKGETPMHCIMEKGNWLAQSQASAIEACDLLMAAQMTLPIEKTNLRVHDDVGNNPIQCAEEHLLDTVTNHLRSIAVSYPARCPKPEDVGLKLNRYEQEMAISREVPKRKVINPIIDRKISEVDSNNRYLFN